MKFSEYMEDKNVFTTDELDIIKSYEELTPSYVNLYKILEIIMGPDNKSLILTNYKFLTKHPLNNVEYNKRGLHIFRIIYSNDALKYRVGLSEFMSSGIYEIKNFVGDVGKVNRIIDEIKSIPVSVNKNPQNLLDTLDSNKFSACKECFATIFQAVLTAIGRTNANDFLGNDQNAAILCKNNSFIQKIVNSPDDNDIQKVAHSDIFSPAIKWWYFPKEIKSGEGAFMYAPGSVQLTKKLLDFYYRESIKISENKVEVWRGNGHAEGSFRFSDEEIKDLGFELKEQTVDADTLVIGNVFGIHSRGFTTKQTERISIHGSIRVNDPFR